MKLIINADDFGFTRGVNLGILEAFKEGIVTSTSMLTNAPGFEHGIELMRQNKDLKVGIHLVLTAGKPLTEGLKTLVNEKGFFEHNFEKIEAADEEEIRKEYRAQIDKFLSTGFNPTHIDFHHGATNKNFAIAVEFAKELGVPMRGLTSEAEKYMESKGVIHSHNFCEKFYGQENVNEESLLKILEESKYLNEMELMTHPAYIDKDLLTLSSYNTQRAYELVTLKSEKIVKYIEANNIKLIDFTDI